MLVSDLLQTLANADPNKSIVVRTANYTYYNLSIDNSNSREVVIEC